MFYFNHSDTGSIGDGTASLLGAVFSMLIGIQFLEFAKNSFLAFVFGILGALGGYLANKTIKWIERRYGSK